MDQPLTALLRVNAPHFTAGAIMTEDKVIHAAPIIYWMVGKDRGYLKRYCKRKGWDIRAYRI